jgi:hypothetical protein
VGGSAELRDVKAATYADAVKVLDNQLDQIFLALLDLNLPRVFDRQWQER